MFGNKTGGNFLGVGLNASDVPLNVCGNWNVRREEIEHIKNELGAVNIHRRTYPGTENANQYIYYSPNNASSMPSATINVTDDSGFCPALAPVYSIFDLNATGIFTSEDVYWYMASLRTTFGNITDEMLYDIPDPTEGLKFTTSPTDLCDQLFDNETIYNLEHPTCSVATVGTKTVITVTPGERTWIRSGMELYFKSNVFTEECDLPVLTHLAIQDGATPNSFEAVFEREDDIPICEDLTLSIDTQGNVGPDYCTTQIKSLADGSDNQIYSSAYYDLINQITTKNYATYTANTFSIQAVDLTALYQEGGRKITFSAYCYDSYGQRVYMESDYNLVTQSSGVKMAYDVDAIVYDTNFGESASFDFEFADCSSGTTTELNITMTLQKINSTGQWEDANGTGEVVQSDFIPPGLSVDNIFRLKIEVVTPGSNTAEEFFVKLEMVIYEPNIILDDFSSFLAVNELNEFTFTEDLFINVDNISESTLQFSCTSCDSGECMGQSGLLDFNSFYDEATKTLSVPNNTLNPDSCYEVEVSVAYKGMVGSNLGFIGTAGAAEASYEAQLSIQDGEFR